ncbi:uncharacterized protein LOC108737907 [Agrilus planipennis]|uniref:Uncharacterized protein LOC108737907 n=1 Tax=Agrilus planipennis TaxID=224129 RepID=A0A1W4X2N8_AGRPL|nr:uncharacterized protein LOC108737907 [Agrilus planipennis]
MHHALSPSYRIVSNCVLTFSAAVALKISLFIMRQHLKFTERKRFLPSWEVYILCVLVVSSDRVFAEVVESNDQMCVKNATTVPIAYPVCFDSNGNIVLKICTPSGWVLTQNQSQCEHSGLSLICPQPFVYKESRCIHFTKPQKADEPCPIPGAGYVEDIGYNDFIWLPFRRNSKFLPYTITTLGSHYGEKADFKCSSNCCSKSRERVHDCLIANATCIQDVPCDYQYPHMCAYKYNHFLHKCPNGCLPAGLGKKHCFCKVSTEKQNATRNNFCRKLAEPTTSSELTAVKVLAFTDTCWISMKNAERFFTNKFPAVNATSIKLHDEGTLSCAVCQSEPVPYSTPEMMLTFDRSARKLFLRVFYPKSLFKDDDGELAYCFVNISKNNAERTDVEEIWDSEDESDSELSSPFKIFEVSIETDTEAFYWCESFKLPNLERITSNEARAYRKSKGCRLASRVIFYGYCYYKANCHKMQIQDFNEMVEDIFDEYEDSSNPTWDSVSVMEIFGVNSTNQTADLLIHFSVEECYALEEVKNLLESVVKPRENKLLILYVKYVDFCLPEVANGLSWPLTPVGSTTIPEQVCVQQNFVPVTRTCTGDHYSGAYWLPVVGTCSNQTLPETSLVLLNVSKSTLNDTSSVLHDVRRIVQQTKEINILDTYTIGNILYQASSTAQSIFKNDITEAIEIINILHDCNDSLLKQSQAILNSTDRILDATEIFLESFNISSAKDGLLLYKQKNLLMLLTNPFVNNITGLVAYGSDFNSFLDMDVDFLYLNSTNVELMDYEDLEIASFISNETLSQLIAQNNLTEGDFKIAIMIYYNESFFQTGKKEVDSKIISISIPGYSNLLPFSVPVFFKREENDDYDSNKTRRCAFWNYGIDAPNSKGQWSSVGVEKSNLFENSIDSCIYSHLTHFALLVSNVPLLVNEDDNVTYVILEPEKNKELEIITLLGCVLSFCGILGIYLTAVLFSSWRRKTGNKILLQLSNATLLILAGLYLLDTANLQNTVWCTILGILLHYAILAKFSWMLVSALMQLYRFVKVIGPMPSHIFLKSLIVGWVLPLIPVVVATTVKFEAYGTEMCYPRNETLYFGVLLPILLILLVNVYVFVAVMNNIRKSHAKFSHVSKDMLRRELYLAILLSFLLGIPWLFGLMIEVSYFSNFLQTLFEYLFCIFASIEGFVLFFFYILLDSATRKMWCRYFNNNFYKAPSTNKNRKSPTNSILNTKDTSKVVINSIH